MSLICCIPPREGIRLYSTSLSSETPSQDTSVLFFVGITLIGAQSLHASSHVFLYQLASELNIPTAPGMVLTLGSWVGINLIT